MYKNNFYLPCMNEMSPQMMHPMMPNQPMQPMQPMQSMQSMQSMQGMHGMYPSQPMQSMNQITPEEMAPLSTMGSQYPTGIPQGQNIEPIPMPGIPGAIAPMQSEFGPPQSLQNVYFTPGFLKTQIGKVVRVEFLIGTNAPLIDRTGTLLEVGASYILLRIAETDDIQLCDIYSIKFVTIFM